MGEWTLPIRRADSVRGIDVLFEGQWTALGCLAGTTWSLPDEGKNARFRAEAEKLQALFLLAPELAEALRDFRDIWTAEGEIDSQRLRSLLARVLPLLAKLEKPTP